MLNRFTFNYLDEIASMKKQLSHIEKTLLLKKDMLDSDEAAFYLGISRNRLYKIAKMYHINHYRPTGGKLYFSRVELDNWIKTNLNNNDLEFEGE